MQKIFLVGNPNTGKSTLFNSLTKSNEHTGNWHGVTVAEKSKIVKYDNNEYEFFDLPGLYSMNAFSMEEEVSANAIKKNPNAKILYLVDACSFKRNMYLALQLINSGYNIKICINNYDYFKKNGGKIDTEKLSKILGCECKIIDARKQKLNKEIIDFSSTLSQSSSRTKNIENNIQFNSSINKDVNSKNYLGVEEIYSQIDKIYSQVVIENKDFVYGKSKQDKYLLKIWVFLPLFLLTMFGILYLTFFGIGEPLSNAMSWILNSFVTSPILAFLEKNNCSIFLIKFLSEGVFSAGLTVCSFLPQICLLYIFLSILEDSGIISRMAFMFDDWLNKIGLNGKCVYTMLMGFGCNTSASFTCKNMTDKNSKIKTALLTPYMSCTAKLPIYSVVAGAFFGSKSILVILGLYVLGITVALLLAFISEKTFLKSKNDNFLIEFPPLKAPNLKRVLNVSFNSAKQFVSKIFGIIFSMSIIIWLLNNVAFNLRFTTNPNQSILSIVSSKISWIFAPLGLNNPAIISALIVGLVAKELIVSSMLIFNQVTSVASLGLSLTLASSQISFTPASSISFLVFVLLYFPCVSNFAVLCKEIGKKYTIIGLILELIVAYVISMLIYHIILGNLFNIIIGVVCFGLIMFALIYIFNRFKNKKVVCNSCFNCHKLR